MFSCKRPENYQRKFWVLPSLKAICIANWMKVKAAAGYWFDMKALSTRSTLCVIFCDKFGIYLNISKVNVSRRPCTCNWHGRVYLRIYTYIYVHICMYICVVPSSGARGTVKWAAWVGGTTLNVQYAHCNPFNLPSWPALTFDLIITFSKMSFSPYHKLIWLPNLGSFCSILPRGVARKRQTHIYEEHKNYWHIWRSHKCAYP